LVHIVVLNVHLASALYDPKSVTRLRCTHFDAGVARSRSSIAFAWNNLPLRTDKL
jgi:hypothetical protein